LAQGPLRYISRRAKGRSPNQLFVALEPLLHEALVDNTALRAKHLSDYYVSRRLSAYSPESHKALVQRMPPDIRALSVPDESGPAIVGSVELDLINFLLHYHNNRVLSIVGSVGVGKTTFVQFVLEDLTRRCKSLSSFVPIFINCLAIGDNAPSFGDLLYEAAKQTKSAFHSRDVPSGKLRGIEQLATNCMEKQARVIPGTASYFTEFLGELINLCQESFEPVIVFDNLDQLDPEAVARIGALSRAAHINTGLTVITALRPSTQCTQLELGYGKGAFYKFIIELPPPDLRSVISRRLRKVLTGYMSLKLKNQQGFDLEFPDIDRSLESLTERLLSHRNQEIFLQEICNNNVRLALVAFEYFLRYRELSFNLLFPVKLPSESSAGSGSRAPTSWLNHLLKGLMVGDREFYVDGEGSPITNILAFNRPRNEPNFLVLYRALALLGWADTMVEKPKLVGWLEDLGHDRALVLDALEFLLQRALVYSPETERHISRARHLRISNSGNYYLTSLVQEPQYLYECIYDVPLPHQNWDDQKGDSFRARIASIFELLEIALQAERSELTYFLDGTARPEILGSIVTYGFFTRQLLNSTSGLLRGGLGAKGEGVRQASKVFEKRLEKFQSELSVAEQQLRTALATHSLLPRDRAQLKSVEMSVGPYSELKIRAPATLSPAEKNTVDVELTLPQAEADAPLVMCWRGTSPQQGFQEFVDLKRTDTHQTYRGKFAVSGVDKPQQFPDSTVTVFQSGNPVFLTRFQI
jgi:hypothetical protein